MSGPHEFVLLLGSCLRRGERRPGWPPGEDVTLRKRNCARTCSSAGPNRDRPSPAGFQVRAFEKGSLPHATTTVPPVLTKCVLATPKAGLFLKHDA